MAKNHPKSPKNDQKSTEIRQKWPKVIWHHLYMNKKSLKIWLNGQKSPQNVKIMQKNAKKWVKKAIKTGQKCRILRHWVTPFRCYTEAHLENQGGPLPSVACSLRSRGAPLVFSVGFGNIFLLPSCVGGLQQHLMAFHDPSKVWLTAHPSTYFPSRLTMIQGIIPL